MIKITFNLVVVCSLIILGSSNNVNRINIFVPIVVSSVKFITSCAV